MAKKSFEDILAERRRKTVDSKADTFEEILEKRKQKKWLEEYDRTQAARQQATAGASTDDYIAHRKTAAQTPVKNPYKMTRNEFTRRGGATLNGKKYTDYDEYSALSDFNTETDNLLEMRRAEDSANNMDPYAAMFSPVKSDPKRYEEARSDYQTKYGISDEDYNKALDAREIQNINDQSEWQAQKDKAAYNMYNDLDDEGKALVKQAYGRDKDDPEIDKAIRQDMYLNGEEPDLSAVEAKLKGGRSAAKEELKTRYHFSDADLDNLKKGYKDSKKYGTPITEDEELISKYDALDVEARHLLEDYKDKDARDILKAKYNMTDDEITILGIYQKRRNDARMGNAEFATEMGQEAAYAGTVGSIASLGSQIVSGPSSVVGLIRDTAENRALEKAGYEGDLTLNRDNPYYMPGRWTKALRQQRGENLDEYWNEKLDTPDKHYASFVYQTVMSGADSVIAAAIGAKLPAVNFGGVVNGAKNTISIGAASADAAYSMSAGGLMLGLGAGVDNMVELADSGASYQTAVLGGLVSGATEMIFEDVSISRMDFFKNAEDVALRLSRDNIKNGVMTAAKKILGSAVTNASEEGLTEIANLIYDTYANGGMSTYAQIYEDAIANGLSPAEAKDIALKQMTKQVLEAAAGGALMGAAFGGMNAYTANKATKYNDRQNANYISYANAQADVLQDAKAVGGDVEGYAQHLAERRGGEENLTDQDLGKIATEIQRQAESDVVSKNKLEKTVKQREEERKATVEEALTAAGGIKDDFARNALMKNYSGGDAETYVKNFKLAVSLAAANQALTPGQLAERLEDDGVADGLSRKAMSAAFFAGKASKVGETGLHDFSNWKNSISDKKARESIEGQTNLIDGFAKENNLSITFVDTQADKKLINGYFHGENQIVVVLNPELEGRKYFGLLTRTVGHETYHWLENYDKANGTAYAKGLKEFILDYYKGTKGQAWIDETLKNQYGKYGYDDVAAQESEFIADHMFDALTSERAINDLVRNKPDLAKSIKEHIGKAIAYLKNAIARLSGSDNYREIGEMRKDLNMLEEVNNRFFDALAEIRGETVTRTPKSAESFVAEQKRAEAGKLSEALSKRQGEMEEAERIEAERKAEEARKAEEERKAKELETGESPKGFLNGLYRLGLKYEEGLLDKARAQKENIFDWFEYYPKYQFALRLATGDESAIADLKEFVNALDDITDVRFARWMMDAFATWQRNYIVHLDTKIGHELAEQTTHKQIDKANARVLGYFTRRETAIQKEKEANGETAGRDIGMKNKTYTTSEVHTLFNELTKNKESRALADKVFSVCQKLGVHFKADRNYKTKSGVQAGLRVRYNLNWMNDPNISDERKAKTLLHEAIHAVTSYYLEATVDAEYMESGPNNYTGYVSKGRDKISTDADKYTLSSRLYGFYDQTVEISADVANAVATLKQIYNGIVGTEGFGNYNADPKNSEYGTKNVKEFVAEFANPTFREKLKQRGLWESIKDAIKKLFGISTNAYDPAAKALDTLLDNYNTDLAQRYHRTYAENMFSDNKSWQFSTVRESYDYLSKFSAKTLVNKRGVAPQRAFSLVRSEELVDNAIAYNNKSNKVNPMTLNKTKGAMKVLAYYLRKNFDKLGLPVDVEGNTAIGNASYGGVSEESTTLCPRSLALTEFADAVSDIVGRPLTVKESLVLAEEASAWYNKNECIYCYVAMDRKAKEEFVGKYIKERNAIIKEVKNGMDRKEAYKKYLNGRKDTKPMQARWALWMNILDNGGEFITAKQLASHSAQSQSMNSDDKAIAEQAKDAMKYAQSASWAKKVINYLAYNGHILKWSDDKIKKLNSQYGLRMYSFSDYSPAYILENMQMVTDASVRGLKMLAYTKEADFVKIFAGTGMNINVSTFAHYDENTDTIVEDNMYGVKWSEAQQLRKDYDNVGVVFVATNDKLVEWGLAQDWIDVVIPFHLVRTGQTVAQHFNFKDYTSESADVKTKEWKKGDKKTIYPPQHNNDKETFLRLCAENHLTPRFDRWVDNPNYMKLVNETRRSAKDTPAVQPTFDQEALDAAYASLNQMIKEGGYMQHVGVTIDNMHELAHKIAGTVKSKSTENESDYVLSTVRDAEYAPTFYSQMGKVVDGIKQDKLSVNGLVNMLKGKGVKDEEIQWSGIEEWLADKGKSVTKQELQEFIQNSMLQIEPVTLSDVSTDVRVERDSDSSFTVTAPNGATRQFFYDENTEMYSSPDSDLEFESVEEADEFFNDPYTNEDIPRNTKWGDYKTEGGSNYREVLFTLPGNNYSNHSMDVHWGRSGVLAHARIQDMPDASGKKMLFIDEIQSDWHNAAEKKENGKSVGYAKNGGRTKAAILKEIDGLLDDMEGDERLSSIVNYIKSSNSANAVRMRLSWLIDGSNNGNLRRMSIQQLEDEGLKISDTEKTVLDSYAKMHESLHNEWQGAPSSYVPPDAPFKNGKYVDYVLKNLLRMAAENGYDKLAWTPAEMQSKRWSDEYAEGYRIEYDQDIPKFLNKFGKKFGAKVGISNILLDSAKQQRYQENIADYTKQAERRRAEYGEADRNYLELLDIINQYKQSLNGTPVWSIDITPAMRESVLYEGQPMYSSVRDEEYMEAVKNNDQPKLKKMVKKAAQNAGYTEEVFHGTSAEKLFTIFEAGSGQYGAGTYFSYDEGIAEGYGRKMNLFVKINKIADYDTVYKMLGKTEEESLDSFAQKLGFDNFDAMIDDWDNDPTEIASNEALIPALIDAGFEGFVDDGNGGFVLWDIPGFETRIKLADPVTYDDDGNIIPLSERFNEDTRDIRYSSVRDEFIEEAKRFRSDIDDWYSNGMPTGESFVLGSTGQTLQGLGAVENDIYLYSDKLLEIMTAHPEITIDEIKKLPQVVDHPVLVLKSKNFSGVKNNTRLVLIGKEKATNNHPIVTVYDVRPKENHLVVDDMQKLVSAYTKTNAADFLKSSKIMYVDKKRSRSLLRAINFLKPDGSDAYRIALSGFVGSISYKKNKVKMDGEDFNNVFVPIPSTVRDTDNIGYHAGDLGKAEFLSQQGGYRGTGHFGTGTYFVGDKEKITKDSSYGKRPQHAVDFSNYNLYKVKNDKDGYDLHDDLKIIDGGLNADWVDMGLYEVSPYRWYKPAEEKGISYKSEATDAVGKENITPIEKSEDLYDWQKENLYWAISYAKEQGYEIPTLKEYADIKEWDISDAVYDYYLDICDIDEYRDNMMQKEAAKRNSGYRKFAEAVRDLQSRFGTAKVDNAIQDVLNYQEAVKTASYEDKRKSDSLATVFMKSLGYDGVDVRGTGLDNTAYGSVIYDINNNDVIYSTIRGLEDDFLTSASPEELADVESEVDRRLALQDEQIITLQEQINELTKQRDDLLKRKGGKDEITKLNNRIGILQSKYDKRMEELQSLRGKLKRRDARIEDLREDRDSARAEMRRAVARERFAERQANTVERQRQIVQIRKITANINKKLQDNTEKSKVIEPLKDSVADFVNAIAHLEAFDKKTSIKLVNSLRDLKDVLDKHKSEDSDSDITTFYDEALAEKIGDLAREISKAVDELGEQATQHNYRYSLINLMSVDRLKEIKEIAKYVQHIINMSNKAFSAGLSEDISEMGRMAASSIGAKKPSNLFRTKLQANMLKPVTFFDMMGDRTMSTLYGNIREGENKWARVVADARQFRIDTQKKHNYDTWKDDTITLALESGNVELSIEDALSLYATIRRSRDQGKQHLLQGGFTLDSQLKITKLEKLKNATKEGSRNYIKAITARLEKNKMRLTVGDMESLINQLSAEQKAYADEMVGYLSDDMAQLGNEVTLRLYGVRKYLEDYYYPITSDPNAVYESGSANGTDDNRIKHMSMTKPLTRKANNPLIIAGFTDTVMRHCSDMGLYYGLALPMEDFTRVWNYKGAMPYEDDDVDIQQVNLRDTIENTYSENANAYIKQLLQDINGRGGRDAGEQMTAKFVSMFKKNAVFGSMSVAIQQPSAIMRAARYINFKYLAETIAQKRDYEELKKWAPVAIVKEMGYFDTGVGRNAVDWMNATEYKGVKGKGKALITDSAYRDELLSKLPSKMDEITWAHLWNACKAEIADTTDLEKGSDEFYEAAAKRFTYIVDRTQVYDSVFSRSQWMRSKGIASQMATAFMAEPTTALNMLYDGAFGKLEKGENRGSAVAKSTAAFISAVALNNALKAIVSAARHAGGDNEDKSLLELYLSALAEGTVDDLILFNYIPYLRDFMSMLKGYDSTRMDTEAFAKVIKAVEKWNKDGLTTDTVREISGALGMFLGVPVANIWKDIEGATNIFTRMLRAVRGEAPKPTAKSLGYAVRDAARIKEPDKQRQYNKLIDSYVSGKNTDKLRNDLEYHSNKGNLSQQYLSNAIKEKLLSGKMSREEAINALLKFYGYKDGGTTNTSPRHKAEEKVDEWLYG